MTTKQADTNDNTFSGSGNENPFAQGQGSPAAVPTDPQMQNSQGFQGIGGGDLPAGNPMTTDQSDPNGSNPDQEAMQQTSGLHIGCMRCGTEANVFDLMTMERVANLRCKCGSDNLVFEAYDWSTADDGESEYYDFTPHTTGYVVSLKPQMEGFRWELDHNNDVVAKGSADSKAQAQAIVEANAPYYVGEQKAAAKSGWKKLADGKPPWLDKGGDDKKPEDKDKKPDDKGAPTDDKKPNPFAGDPDKDPAGAPPDDGNAAAMDAAQKVLDDAVANLATLGHDAKEIKYDVDALESEWRCVNCGLEGQATISDDGQTDLQGDLFEDQTPCASPADPAQPDDATAPGVVPPAPAAPPAGAAPAAPDQTPVQAAKTPTHDPYAPVRAFETNTTEAKSGTKVKCTVPGCGWETTRPGTHRGGQLADLWTEHAKSVSKTANHDDINDNRANLNAQNSTNQVDDDEATNEKVSVIIEGILGSNPGMNEESARKIAALTVQRYPSVIGD